MNDFLPNKRAEIPKGNTVNKEIYLLRKAKGNPGNWAHQKLINEYGYTEDYTPADHGTGPIGG